MLIILEVTLETRRRILFLGTNVRISINILRKNCYLRNNIVRFGFPTAIYQNYAQNYSHFLFINGKEVSEK